MSKKRSTMKVRWKEKDKEKEKEKDDEGSYITFHLMSSLSFQRPHEKSLQLWTTSSKDSPLGGSCFSTLPWTTPKRSSALLMLPCESLISLWMTFTRLIHTSGGSCIHVWIWADDCRSENLLGKKARFPPIMYLMWRECGLSGNGKFGAGCSDLTDFIFNEDH
jgi:hypothetical protein